MPGFGFRPGLWILNKSNHSFEEGEKKVASQESALCSQGFHFAWVFYINRDEKSQYPGSTTRLFHNISKSLCNIYSYPIQVASFHTFKQRKWTFSLFTFLCTRQTCFSNSKTSRPQAEHTKCSVIDCKLKYKSIRKVDYFHFRWVSTQQ